MGALARHPGGPEMGAQRGHCAIVRETLEDMDPEYPKVDWDPKSFKVVERPRRAFPRPASSCRAAKASAQWRR